MTEGEVVVKVVTVYDEYKMTVIADLGRALTCLWHPVSASTHIRWKEERLKS